jgi:hypothetical protein
MRLSAFFRDIDLFWQSRTLIAVAFIAFAFGVGIFLGNRLAKNQYSTPLVYGGFSLALIIALGIAETNSPFQLFTNPVAAAFFGAVSGAGQNVYERLMRV